jgi:hypothetical protein
MSNDFIADRPSIWMNTEPAGQVSESARRVGLDNDIDGGYYDALRGELESIVDGDYDDVLNADGIERFKRALRYTLRNTPKREPYRR